MSLPAVSPRRRKEARPGEIAAAALELFVERGFAATKLDDVAERAGVSKGTVYLYFDSKEALFKAAIDAAMTPTVEAAEALADKGDRPAAERLRCFVKGWWRMVGTSTLSGLPKLLVAESGNFPEVVAWFHEAIISRAHKAMTRIIEHGVKSGEFRPVAASAAARVVFAPMFSYLVWRRSFEQCMRDLPAPESFFETALDVLIEGLAVRGKKKS